MIRIKSMGNKIKKSTPLYVIIALPIIYLLIFNYYPLYGAQIAFKDFIISKGILGSPWIGFDNFVRFFKSPMLERVIFNTLKLTLYNLAAGTPMPIILAMCLNYVNNKRYKRAAQIITYAPNFISQVVFVGILFQVLSPDSGIVNKILSIFGIEPIRFMYDPKLFRSVYIWSGIWKEVGFNSIIYLAALTGIDPNIHEAAVIDGANRVKRMWHIDLPGIMSTIVILLILRCGNILNTGFEKILLMQSPINLSVSETIDTYVYKIGLASTITDFSYSTAIGLFKSVIGLLLMIGVNQISKRVTNSSLW